jgi:propanol-preferring alcohol dehydrogenase
VPIPQPEAHQVLIRVQACAVCRTDLHIVDGELPNPKLPLILGHEIVGEVVQLGAEVSTLQVGQRVGVPWLGWTCGACRYCEAGRENLCPFAKFTGYTLDGGYAEYAVADARYVFPIPDGYDAVSCSAAAVRRADWLPLVPNRAARDGGQSAGAVRLRRGGAHPDPDCHSRRDARVRLHAPWRLRDARPCARAGRVVGRRFRPNPPRAAGWGDLFAPAGELVPAALRAVDKGGVVVCGGIHMSDIPSFPYAILWGERVVRSVANLTREDGVAFFERTRLFTVQTHPKPFPLEQANEALQALREGKIRGAAVLVP